MKKIAIINGPNLDRLGKREPGIYGKESLADLEEILRKHVDAMEVELRFIQSSHEGEIVERIAECADGGFSGIIINAGAYTHTSIAIRDALAGANLPCVEVHISNIYAREDFRKRSYTAAACSGVISGLGLHGYIGALDYLVHRTPGSGTR